MGADARTNPALWSEANSQFTDARAERAWAAPEITWGLFDVPETDVVALGELPGRDLIELGCGTAYFSAWLAVRGLGP